MQSISAASSDRRWCWAKDYTGSFAGGLYALAAFALMSAVISVLWLRIPNPLRQEMASVPAQ